MFVCTIMYNTNRDENNYAELLEKRYIKRD